MTNAANFFAAFEACLPAAYEVSCRIRTGSPTSFWLDSPRTVASRHSIGSPVPRRRGLGRQAATRRRHPRVYVFACGCQSRPSISGMAAVVQRFAIVMRTFLIAVVVLTITGIVPVLASLDSCAMKPCCMHEQAIATASHRACCNETSGSMTPARPVALTQRTGVREGPLVPPSLMAATIPVTAHDHGRHHSAWRSPLPPPETFSVLLI